MIRCVRMWTGEDGNSLFEEGTLELNNIAGGDNQTPTIAVNELTFRETVSGGSFDWHQDPVPRYVITLSGTLEFETKDGSKFIINPGDILLAQDNTGTGHKWRLIGDEPWRRAYVVYQEGTDLCFTPTKKIGGIMSKPIAENVDIALIGAGIMSATLGTFLKELEPSLTIAVFERLNDCAQESSHPWNNAGTGHAANCEMNYTPPNPDGTVDISKALEVNTEFDLSRQLWSYLVTKGKIKDPRDFIHPCPHMSFVWGEDNVKFLKQRYQQMSAHHCYHNMEYSDDPKQINEWAPLIMEGRDPKEAIAVTRVNTGADVDYGALTHLLIAQLSEQPGFSIHYKHEVIDVKKTADGRWNIEVKNLLTHEKTMTSAKFVFVGAGGRAIELLQKSGIPEGKGYGGFPVSGIWLRCDNEEIASRHHAKVYGKADKGSPPMSVPHLDTRIIGGKRSLLFGPYAGFSSKFLKHGSYLDLFESVKLNNIEPMLAVAKDNWSLAEYLVGQVLQTSAHQFAMLQQFYPEAQHEDWKEVVAGQRVQIIKPDHDKKGVLEFGTELITSADKSFTVLMGASPGASTAAFIALNVLKTCFDEQLKADGWETRLKDIIPTYGIDLKTDAKACLDIRTATAKVLQLDN